MIDWIALWEEEARYMRRFGHAIFNTPLPLVEPVVTLNIRRVERRAIGYIFKH